MAPSIFKMESIKNTLHQNWGWVVVFCSFWNFVTTFGLLYSYGLIFVALQADFNSSTTLTSWVGSIAIGLHTLGSFVSNPLISKFSNRPVAFLGLFMCFFSTIISSMMPTITPLFVTFSLLYGFGINFVLISSMNLILKYFPGVNCSRATSVALVGTTAGMLIMSPLIQMMIDSYGWRNMFRVMGAAILLLGVPSCSMYSQPPAKEPTPQVVGFDEGGRPMISAASERENAMKERVIRANDLNKEAEKEEAEELNKTTGENSKEKQANTSVTSSRRVSFADNPQTTGEEAKRLLRQQSVTIPEEVDDEVDDEGDEEGDDEVMMSQEETEAAMNDLQLREKKPLYFKLKGTLIWKILMVMKLPELWFISIALMGCAMTMSFYYVSLGNFMKILGFTGTQRSLTISIIAVSEIIGKILLSLFGDHLPFGKIYLFVISSVLGIGIMLSLLFLVRDFPSMILLSIVTGCIVMTVFDALPYSICNQVFGKKRRVEAWTVILCANGIGLILGSLFGESVDKTGSYDDALYLSIIIYCVAFVLYLLVPIYQKCFTKRFIMAKEKKRKITLADEWGVGGPHPNLDRRESFSPSPLTNETRVDRESCV